jgi:RNA polymerase sigma-70 factor (ECF subfamily)
MESKEDSEALVSRARNGDRGAFERLVEANRARLEALDVVQETHLQAFRSIGSFRWQGKQSFVRWLGGIAEHVIRKEYRGLEQRRRVRLEPRRAEQSTPSKNLRRRERFDRLEKALASLSDDHRQVIILARIERLRVKEIARRMERSESAVRNLLLRALRELQRSFGDSECFRPHPESLAEGREP